jgi:hypothetical protein
MAEKAAEAAPERTLTSSSADAAALVEGSVEVDGAGEGASTVDEDTKSYALQQGWIPKERFKGDEKKWVDADVYAERARSINPIIKQRNRQLEDQLAAANAKIAQHDEEIKTAVNFVKSAERRAYDDKLGELQRERAEAVTNGDGEAFATVEAKIEALKPPAEKPAPKTEPQVPVIAPEMQQAGADFATRNTWFGDQPGGDPRKTRIAMALAADLRAEQPNLVKTPLFFDELERRIHSEYPELFRKKTTPALTDGDGVGASATTGRKNGSRGYADLPPDAKKMADRYAANEWLTKEAYAKEYFAVEAQGAAQ